MRKNYRIYRDKPADQTQLIKEGVVVDYSYGLDDDAIEYLINRFDKICHTDGMLDNLSGLYNDWLRERGYPRISADELHYEVELDDEEKAWIREFLVAWEMMTEYERQEVNLMGKIDDLNKLIDETFTGE